MLVEIDQVSKRFGGLQALDNVTFAARSGEVTAVIGPNGAGKSTLIDCLSGLTPIDSGAIRIDGQGSGARMLDQLVALGVSRTFQNIRLFTSLSVIEHVILAQRAFVRSARAKATPRSGSLLENCLALLERVSLLPKAQLRTDELSYGERRRLEIARALAIEPRVLLLDEPAAGSTAVEQLALAELIRSIAAEGTAVILVEHHMDLVGRVAASVVVLNFGKVLVTGPMAEVRQDPRVISAYLGTTHVA